MTELHNVSVVKKSSGTKSNYRGPREESLELKMRKMQEDAAKA